MRDFSLVARSANTVHSNSDVVRRVMKIPWQIMCVTITRSHSSKSLSFDVETRESSGVERSSLTFQPRIRTFLLLFFALEWLGRVPAPFGMAAIPRAGRPSSKAKLNLNEESHKWNSLKREFEEIAKNTKNERRVYEVIISRSLQLMWVRMPWLLLWRTQTHGNRRTICYFHFVSICHRHNHNCCCSLFVCECVLCSVSVYPIVT